LDTLKESYLRQALKDAIAVGSDLMLQDAVEKVDACRMGAQLPSGLAGIYDQAKAALLEYSQVKTTLAALTSALTYASTVPRLVASVDSVKALVLEARGQGMGNELVVAEAVLRLAKVKNLLELRDRLRMAIEICSPSLMDRWVASLSISLFFFLSVCQSSLSFANGSSSFLFRDAVPWNKEPNCSHSLGLICSPKRPLA
jgi:hypothetical protein